MAAAIPMAARLDAIPFCMIRSPDWFLMSNCRALKQKSFAHAETPSALRSERAQ
jgi:hypothetical protein